MPKFGITRLAKLAPIVMAGVMAVVQAIGEQKQQEKLDDMEARLAKLEAGKES